MKFRIKSNQSVGNAVVKNLEAHGYNSMGDPLKKEDEDSIDESCSETCEDSEERINLLIKFDD